MTTDSPLELEEAGWQALSTNAGAAFYGEVMAEDAVLVVPGMVVDGARFVASLPGTTPWARHRIEDPRIVELGGDCAAVVYHVRARREGEPEYCAHVTSVYVRTDGGWKLKFHQQTPDPSPPAGESTSATSMFDGIDHIAFTVADLRVSEPWYRNAFGLVREMYAVRDDGSGHAALKHPGTGMVFSLLSSGPAGGGRPGVEHVGLECRGRDELVRWRDELQARGVEVGTITDATYGSGFVVRDPDGTQLELFTEPG